MTGWLEGRRALVVGAGSGIGRAVVDAYLAEGAQVAALEVDPGKARDLAAALPHVVVTTGDARDSEVDDRAVAAAVGAMGGLDVLVVCVGVFDWYRSLEEIEPDVLPAAFDDVMGVNVLAPLQVVRSALPALRASEHPVVLLTESTSAYHPGRGGVLYVASKFAVRGIATALAHDLAPQVRVNSVAPGGTTGTDLRGVPSLGTQDRSLGAEPRRADDLAARTHLQVALSPQDHAWAYVWLGSQRSRGVTAGVVHSDGGVAVAAPRKRS